VAAATCTFLFVTAVCDSSRFRGAGGTWTSFWCCCWLVCCRHLAYCWVHDSRQQARPASSQQQHAQVPSLLRFKCNMRTVVHC
jgi:hypothetical protein